MQRESTLPVAKDSPAATRELVRDVLEPYPEQLVAEAQLLTSELVTNAVVHGSPPIRLDIQINGGRLRVAVGDATPHRRPVLREAGPSDAHGRGLTIVDLLAEAWGVISDDFGKTVWFTLTI